MLTSYLKIFIRSVMIGADLGCLCADEVMQSDGSHVSGVVQAIHENGMIELRSPLAMEPLLLKANTVKRVKFTEELTKSSALSGLVRLRNGDQFLASVQGLSDVDLQVSSQSLGHLNLPRELVESIQFGIREKKMIYAGPNTDDEWVPKIGSVGAWRLVKGVLTSSSAAVAGMPFEVPQQFGVKFTLRWQSDPALQLYFADPLTPAAERVDRYYLQFNSAGFEIKRESSKGRHFHSVMMSPRGPDQFPKNQLDIEIRVDRKTSRLDLFLDGALEASGVDPAQDATTGGGLSLLSAAPTGSVQEVFGIQLFEPGQESIANSSDDEADSQSDRMLSRDEEIWSGRLSATRLENGGFAYSLKGESDEQTIELAEADLVKVFFAKPEHEVESKHKLLVRVKLREHERLGLASIALSDGKVTAVHPLLGVLKFEQTAISVLDWIEDQPEEMSEE
ncbi:MAG: hypothetical protein ORN51_13190 [Akkermansiaceae bacterium]|nr:hypothetical protein [Akkermansiaceae bacterium]